MYLWWLCIAVMHIGLLASKFRRATCNFVSEGKKSSLCNIRRPEWVYREVVLQFLVSTQFSFCTSSIFLNGL